MCVYKDNTSFTLENSILRAASKDKCTRDKVSAPPRPHQITHREDTEYMLLVVKSEKIEIKVKA